MLHRCAFKNFFSFRDEVVLDFQKGGKGPDTDWFADDAGLRVAKVVAIIGPNASGKTNVLKPLVFLDWFMRGSFQLKPEAPLAVNPHWEIKEQPSEFQIDFGMKNELWRYQLSVVASGVQSEVLQKKTSRLYSTVFSREGSGSDTAFKQSEFGFPKQAIESLRPNASVISTALHFKVPLALELGLRVNSNVNVHGREWLAYHQLFDAASYFAAHPDHKELMSSLMTSWDLGLSSVDVMKHATTDDKGATVERWLPVAKHNYKSGIESQALHLESNGTQAAFILLSRLLTTLERGGMAVIDEIDNSLHPMMLTPLLRLFSNERTNPGNAQLVFTCHAIEILNEIGRNQVHLVHKGEHCVSQLTRLDQFAGIRPSDDIYAKYMAGAFGAVPDIQ